MFASQALCNIPLGVSSVYTLLLVLFQFSTESHILVFYTHSKEVERKENNNLYGNKIFMENERLET